MYNEISRINHLIDGVIVDESVLLTTMSSQHNVHQQSSKKFKKEILTFDKS